MSSKSAPPPSTDFDFRTLVENAPVMIWRARSDKQYDWFNKPWLELTGRSLEDEVGYGWLDNIHPDDRERYLAVSDAAFAQRIEFSVTFRLRRHDGVYRSVLSKGRPFYAPDGTFNGYFGSCEDVTEHKEAEQRLLAAFAEQASLVEEVRHRVRNNMQVVVGFVNLLSRSLGSLSGLDLAQLSVRLQALARMQQYFYSTPDRVSHVELGDFLRRFATEFARDAAFAAHVEIDGNDMIVDIGQATSIGLTVAEAILNCESLSQRNDIHIALQQSTAQVLVSIENHCRPLQQPANDGSAVHLRLLQHYARLMAGAVEVTQSSDTTKIVLRLVA